MNKQPPVEFLLSLKQRGLKGVEMVVSDDHAGLRKAIHKTLLQEFYQETFREKVYSNLEVLQQDLDSWLIYYNKERTQQDKMSCGRNPLETLEDGKRLWQNINLN